MNAVVLEDAIGNDCVRRLTVMAEKAGALDHYAANLPKHAKVKRWQDELRVHRLQASWPLRQVVHVRHPFFDGDINPLATCPYAFWWIGTEKVSVAMIEAGVIFALETGQEPQVALIRQIPANAVEFVEVRGITLVQADWIPSGFVAVMRGGMWSGLPAYKVL